MPNFTVGKYLATRLEQIGLKHYFMVPGDYNLVLLDELLENENIEQIGCCNELNAAYAAEGYARVNGAGAVLTTFNVGAFSALNGVAGAYAERLPVIVVSSGPNTNDVGSNHVLHHTMDNGELSDQYEIFRKVTCKAVRIVHPDTAPALIDEAISAALRERKPAYIEIPCNLSAAPCSDPAPFDTLPAWEPSNERMLTDAVGRASDLVQQAKKPILLAGVHLRAHGAIDAFRELAEALGCAVAVMPNAKGFFPEDHPQYVGIYWGEVSSPQCQAIVDWADLIVAAGAVFNDYTTVGWSAQPARGRLVSAEPRKVQLPDAEYHGVALAEFLSDLAKKVPTNAATLTQYHRLHRTTSAPVAAADVDPTTPLSRVEMWRQIEQDLDSKTTLLVETGDSWLNGMYTRLPGGARFEIEMQYGSIGWSVPATLRLRERPGARPAPGLGDRRRILPADRAGSVQHDPPRPRAHDLPGQQPRIRDRVGDPRRSLQLLQELGLRRPDRRVQRRRGRRARLGRQHRWRTGRGDQQGTRPQGRAGLDRVPNPQRRRQP